MFEILYTKNYLLAICNSSLTASLIFYLPYALEEFTGHKYA